MSHFTFYVAGRCDAAGRKSNQDSMMVWPDISAKGTAHTGPFDIPNSVNLSDAGSLLVVADGMGGMRSGEKASELVVTGLRDQFERLTAADIKSVNSATSFLSSAIVHADSLIKKYAAEHPESRGMGSTLAMVWLFRGQAIVAWCGDSRVYRFNPANGLVRLSHDHSYVQALVDNGKIDPEDAFDHPDSNIITRSMGDSSESVKPEIKVYDMYDNDILLLCSDGLCGLMPEKQIAEILMKDKQSTSRAVKDLWSGADELGFSDNCTILLARVNGTGNVAGAKTDGYPEVVPAVRRPASSPISSRIVPQPAAAPVPTMSAPGAGAPGAGAPVAGAPAAAAPAAPKATAPASSNKKGIVAMIIAIIAVAVAAWFIVPLFTGDDDDVPTVKGGRYSYNVDDEQAAEGRERSREPFLPMPSSGKSNDVKPENNVDPQALAAYVSSINNLHGQIAGVKAVCLNVATTGKLSPAEGARLRTFVKQVNTLNMNASMNSRLDAESKNRLKAIQGVASQASSVLVSFKGNGNDGHKAEGDGTPRNDGDGDGNDGNPHKNKKEKTDVNPTGQV